MLSIKEINKKRLITSSGQKKKTWAFIQFLRRFSLPFTIVAYYLRITPNQISMFSLLFIAIASVLMGMKDYRMSIIGCVLLFLYVLLDLVDGEIARLRKSESLRGDYLEALNHDIAMPLIYFAIGLKAYYHFNSIYFVYIGFFSAFFAYLTNLLKLNKYKLIIKLMRKGRKINIPEGKHQIMDNYEGTVKFFILKIFSDVEKVALFLLALSIFDLLHYAIFFYAPFAFIVMIAKLYIEYKSGFKEFGLRQM